MKQLLSSIRININSNLYVKDPESSELGKKIVQQSILLIDKIGFENFTFKKLGHEIDSNESSVYRYFENKHKLLLYLTSWFWGWKEYQLVFSIANLTDPKSRLQNAIKVLTRRVEKDAFIAHVDEEVLNRVIVNEFSKSYLTKEVDNEHRAGFFSVYDRLVKRLKDLILEYDGDYLYPACLASTILEGSLHQYFLKEHFPALTECDEKISPSQFFIHMVFNSLSKK